MTEYDEEFLICVYFKGKGIYMKRIKAFIVENKLFSLFFLGMAVYYAVSMFAIKPWYDELYTYYSFISRGPVYAAIHWPVPNNHVFYSVLSAFLDYLGNPYIGLRGVSFLMSCANMLLLYQFAKKFLNRFFSAGVVFLYVAVWQVNNLSVQGRGYTLAATCYLLALLSLFKICKEQARRRDYILYVLSLTGGLYTLVSSTFWVIPVCITGGITLLFTKKYKTLWKLIAASVVAAGLTVLLYAVIWLAIGSNLMSKDPAGIYYGIYQVKIILKTPFEALRTGMEYMLATPYIQGDERSYIVKELFHYLTGVFNLFYAGFGAALVVILAIGGVLAVVSACFFRKKEYNQWFFQVYLAVSVVMVPVMLVIQSVQPYYRVFSFLAVPVSLMLVWLLKHLVERIFRFSEGEMVIAGKYCCLLLLGFALFELCGSSYHSQYAERETEIADIFRGHTENLQTCFPVDDYQKYVLKFYYDREPAEVTVTDAQCILIPKEIYDETKEIPQWPTLYGYGAVDTVYIKDHFTQVNESEHYELYIRKE